MGEVINFKCTDPECGWAHGLAYVGGGMNSSGELLYLCRACHEVTSFDSGPLPWAMEPGDEAVVIDCKCSICGKVGVPWPDENEEGDLPDRAECPKCQKLSVSSETLGIWD